LISAQVIIGNKPIRIAMHFNAETTKLK